MAFQIKSRCARTRSLCLPKQEQVCSLFHSRFWFHPAEQNSKQRFVVSCNKSKCALRCSLISVSAQDVVSGWVCLCLSATAVLLFLLNYCHSPFAGCCVWHRVCVYCHRRHAFSLSLSISLCAQPGMTSVVRLFCSLLFTAQFAPRRSLRATPADFRRDSTHLACNAASLLDTHPLGS